MARPHSVIRSPFEHDNFILDSFSSLKRAVSIAEFVKQKSIYLPFKAEFRVDAFSKKNVKRINLLKQSGLEEVFPGIKSLSIHILYELNKDINALQIHRIIEYLNNAGIVVNAGKIFAISDSTIEEIQGSLLDS